MNGLSAAALARPLDSAQGVWELSHDFVARAVARYLGRRRVYWPGMARAYAAPALFVLTAAAAAGAIAWHANASDRLRAQLADFGVEVSQDGHEAAIGARFNSENWVKAGPLIGKLTALRSLYLQSTDVEDLAPLSSLTALESLDLSHARVDDLTPLQGLITLRSLNLWDTQVDTIAPLKGLTALRALDLSFTNVADIGPLKELKALKTLKLVFTQITRVGPLKDLEALEMLDLSDTQITDIGPLKDLRVLQWLGLLHTPVVDLTTVQDLPRLTKLSGVSDENLAKINANRVQKGLPALSNR
jgi:Leucine-rich repeat (LRR) protein